MHTKIVQLIAVAQAKMLESKDPIHDIHHVRRVVEYADRIAKKTNLTEQEYQAVILAAWWHDVGRTVTKGPSMMMVFFDDLFSSIMLWMYAIKFGMFSDIVHIAAQIIFCKSLSTGTFFRRLLLNKRKRHLLNIIQDSDFLDILHTERTDTIYSLALEKRKFQFSYRILSWWLFTLKRIKLKTEEAKEVFIELFDAFVIWLQLPHIQEWHIDTFGAKWTERKLRGLKYTADKFS